LTKKSRYPLYFFVVANTKFKVPSKENVGLIHPIYFKERIRIGPFLKAGTEIALENNLTMEKEKNALNRADRQ